MENWNKLCWVLTSFVRRTNPSAKGWIMIDQDQRKFICHICGSEHEQFKESKEEFLAHGYRHLKELNLTAFI